MANIISLSGARTARSAGQERSVSAGAEIVIFPGVRYERNADSVPNPVSATEDRKRDRLTIPD